MIRHLLKLIWNERGINYWIFFEFVFVFCIIWFCSDILVRLGKRYFEPVGFNIEHVYKIEMSLRDGLETPPDKFASAVTVMDRLKRYPGVESVSLSYLGAPYTKTLTAPFKPETDTLWSKAAYCRGVTNGFFDVFKVNIVRGSFPQWDDEAMKAHGVITGDENDMLGTYHVSQIHEAMGYNNAMVYVDGYTNKMKVFDFGSYINNVITPIRRGRVDLTYDEISVRVRPEADKDFVNRFKKEMQDQLDVNGYYMTAVIPYSQLRSEKLMESGIMDTVYSIFAITGFLIVNIFLGVIGTFWFRTQSRRSEVGLRIAMGSSKGKVMGLMFAETLLLLFLSSVVAAAICVNMTEFDLLKSFGYISSMPTVETHITNYLITFAVLAVISLLAVWYPAKQASDIQPAEALHDE